MVVGFQRAAEVLAFYFPMPFASEKRQCIRSPLFDQDVWLTKKLAKSTYFEFILLFYFFCYTSFLGSKLDSEGNLPIVEGGGVNRSR